MPTYEYQCLDCQKKVSIYQSYQEYGEVPVTCSHCGGERLERLIGRVRFMRSEDARLESLADPTSWGDFDEEDPRSMGRFMRKMSRELGEEMPPEFDEVVDRLESGESPEEIEKTMPDLGMGGGGLDIEE